MTLHVEATAQRLRELPGLAARLPDALTHASKDRRSGQIAHSPAPLNLDAARLLDTRTRYDWTSDMADCDPDRMGVQPYLRSWVLDLEASILDSDPSCLPDEPGDNQSVQASCAWLLHHIDAIARQPQWDEFAWGIQRTHAACRTAIAPIDADPPTDPTCRACHTGHLHPDSPTQWTCNTCGTIATIHPVTIPQAATQLHIGTGTLYRWANQGRFTRTPRPDGTYLYDLRQITAAVAELRLTQAKTRT